MSGGYVTPGQRLNVPASVWNNMVRSQRTAGDNRRTGGLTQSAIGSINAANAHASIVNVYTPHDVEPFEAVQLGSPYITDPRTDEAQAAVFATQVTGKWGPNSTDRKYIWGVCQQQTKAGDLAPVLMVGLTACKIKYRDDQSDNIFVDMLQIAGEERKNIYTSGAGCGTLIWHDGSNISNDDARRWAMVFMHGCRVCDGEYMARLTDDLTSRTGTNPRASASILTLASVDYETGDYDFPTTPQAGQGRVVYVVAPTLPAGTKLVDGSYVWIGPDPYSGEWMVKSSLYCPIADE